MQPLPVNHFKKCPQGPFTLFEFNGKFKMKANKRNELSSYLNWPPTITWIKLLEISHCLFLTKITFQLVVSSKIQANNRNGL